MRPIAICPNCEHHALQIRSVRTVETGAELDLTCRACGEPVVLVIAESPHPSGDDLANTITATTSLP